MQPTKGFTLIELLMVVVIIGILMTIALPKYQVTVDKATFASMRVAVEALSRAEETYYDSHGDYTNNVDNLSIDFALEKWENVTMPNASGVNVELARTGTYNLKTDAAGHVLRYVTIDYVNGYTPEGSFRDERYVYAYDGEIGVAFIRWLKHAVSKTYGHMAGHSYCVVHSGGAVSPERNQRAIRLCKSLGGDNTKEPLGVNETYYLLPN